uniref:Uncharacterized protein n=1 Tax=Opuntia streptacantha TaxID=393608 RepID=A0A7C9AVE2_OPUST
MDVPHNLKHCLWLSQFQGILRHPLQLVALVTEPLCNNPGSLLRTSCEDTRSIVYYIWYIPFLLSRYVVIENDRKAPDQGLCYCSWPCLCNNTITSSHPFLHLLLKSSNLDWNFPLHFFKSGS